MGGPPGRHGHPSTVRPARKSVNTCVHKSVDESPGRGRECSIPLSTRLPMAQDQASGPLSGYRVLEMGSTVAGPFCGRLLADFGAEVIKVEPVEGDPVRTMGKRFHGKSLYAASIFRNKSLISVDLRTKEGQEVVRRLAAKCDVVVENFRPGGLEKWGLGYAELSRINPGLVMVRISGFGQTGPYSERAGYGVIGEAVSGLR